MTDDVLVRVENVSKRFCRSLKRSLWTGLQDMGTELFGFQHGGRRGLPQNSSDVELRKDEFWAVKDVSFELRRGECLGLIGHNGAGKTTLLRMLNGLIKPDTGRIEMRGKIGALIALGAGFNPVLTGRENIRISGSIAGLSNQEIKEKTEEIIDFSGLAACIDSPVQTYSSGMQVRLGFAAASAISPDILILDEVLAVGDMAFHAKCFKKIGSLSKSSAIIFVSHDLSSVNRVCERALLMSAGCVEKDGTASDVTNAYTQKLDLYSFYGQSVEINDSLILRHLGICPSSSSTALDTRDSLSISIEILAEKPVNIGLFLISFYLNGSLQVAQVDIRRKDLSFLVGLNSMNVMIPSICLASGMYTLNCAIYASNKRELLVHAISFAKFYIEGDPYMGSCYKIPAVLECKQGVSLEK